VAGLNALAWRAEKLLAGLGAGDEELGVVEELQKHERSSIGTI